MGDQFFIDLHCVNHDPVANFHIGLLSRQFRARVNRLCVKPNVNHFAGGCLDGHGSVRNLGYHANDVFLVGPQVAADTADGTIVGVRSGDGADRITVVRADVATTIDTGPGTDVVTIAADGKASLVQ